jgi:hypothetical protein
VHSGRSGGAESLFDARLLAEREREAGDELLALGYALRHTPARSA